MEPPTITTEEAMAAAGSRLQPRSTRLCIIPQNRAEYLCYEILAEDGEDAFLVYIDAHTGVERELMQLLQSANGTLVM